LALSLDPPLNLRAPWSEERALGDETMWWLRSAALAWHVQTVPGTDLPVWWQNMPLEYTAVDDEVLPDGALEAIDAAFASWSNVEGSRAGFVARRSPDARGRAALDEHHTVFVDHDWPYGEQVLALAAVWSNAETGELLHYDVRLNGDLIWSVGGGPGYDLQSTLTHEVGHVLGLDHTDLEEAAMFADLEAGGFVRDLHDDDADGARALYPLDEFSGAGCSATSSGVGTAVLTLLAALMLRKGRA